MLESIQLTLATANDAAAHKILARELGAFAELQTWQLGRNFEGSWGAGTHTLDLIWSGAARPNLTAALAKIPGYEKADAVIYARIGGGLREPQLQNGVWRTLFFRTRPVPQRQIEMLEHDLLQMPQYMRGIRNWQLSRVISGSGWTHVWQQEYAALDDLLGEYLLHPFHWGWVDRWFDMEFPEWTVDNLCHAFCPLPRSILATIID